MNKRLFLFCIPLILLVKTCETYRYRFPFMSLTKFYYISVFNVGDCLAFRPFLTLDL